jgi:hypothetical protein
MCALRTYQSERVLSIYAFYVVAELASMVKTGDTRADW